MKVVTRLLLGTACAIAASEATTAADLPFQKAAPVDYIRVCDFTGAGFFYIPGTDTCMQIGAILRTEYAFISQQRALMPVPGAAGRSSNVFAQTIPGASRDATGFLDRPRLNLDTRTKTAYGTLRTFIQYQIERDTGLYAGGGAVSKTSLRRGFIQFAGITAGRVQSFFDFYADNYNYEGIATSDSAQSTLAYTYNGPSGLSATFALEDRTSRNLAQNVGNILGGANAVAVAARYAGESIPDLVGVLRSDQTWGSAQLSAAYHDIQTNAGPLTGTGGAGFSHAATDGFAVQGGLRIKLPMLANGDDLWLQGAYQQGAYLYQDSANYMSQGKDSPDLGGFLRIDRDAIAYHIQGAPAGTYSLLKGQGFSALAAVNHYFSSNYHDVLFGSYEQTSYGRGRLIDWTLGGLGNASEYRVGNQFLWDPVKNLEFGLEVDYLHVDQTLAHNPGVAATALPIGIAQNPDAFETRLRVERDF